MANQNRPFNEHKALVLWLGVATSVITILAWFGVSNWNDLESAVAVGTSSASPSSASTTPAPTSSYPPTPDSPSPSPSPLIDPGCPPALGAIRSYLDISQPNPVPWSQNPGLASEVRAVIEQLNQAMSQAHNDSVAIRLQALSSDLSTLAGAYAVGDASTASSAHNQAKSDTDALLNACKATIASPPAS